MLALHQSFSPSLFTYIFPGLQEKCRPNFEKYYEVSPLSIKYLFVTVSDFVWVIS